MCFSELCLSLTSTWTGHGALTARARTGLCRCILSLAVLPSPLPHVEGLCLHLLCPPPPSFLHISRVSHSWPQAGPNSLLAMCPGSLMCSQGHSQGLEVPPLWVPQTDLQADGRQAIQCSRALPWKLLLTAWIGMGRGPMSQGRKGHRLATFSLPFPFSNLSSGMPLAKASNDLHAPTSYCKTKNVAHNLVLPATPWKEFRAKIRIKALRSGKAGRTGPPIVKYFQDDIL